jgi:hypothetical protein
MNLEPMGCAVCANLQEKHVPTANSVNVRDAEVEPARSGRAPQARPAKLIVVMPEL